MLLADGAAPELVLRDAMGSAFAARFVDVAGRASLRRVKKDPDALPPPGRTRARAKPELRAFRKRDDDPALVRQALALLMIAGWLQPGEKRTGSSDRQDYKLSAGELGRRIGVSTREVTRYHAVWEATGLLSVWQPNGDTSYARGPSGHCYTLYEWRGPLPPELVAHLERWHGEAWARERAEQQAQAIAPAAAPASAPAGVTFTDGAPDPKALASALLARPPNIQTKRQ